jgi:hypothetical protein
MNEKPKTYIINFYAKDVNLWQLTQYLHDSRDIIAYWNYIPLVYCIKSYLLAGQLASKLQPYFPRGTFMIAEIDPGNINGFLPAEAWSWFYMDHHEKQELPPSLVADLLSPSGISGQLLPPLPPLPFPRKKS